MAAPVNYTTRIEAAQTVTEMQALLAKHGARRIAVDYDGSGVPSSLDFMLETPHGQRGFSLPANVDRMEQLLAAEMVDVDQALMAFLVVGDAGQILYEVYKEREALALPAGTEGGAA